VLTTHPGTGQDRPDRPDTAERCDGQGGPRPGQARDWPAVSWWASVSAGRTDAFLGERHRRIAHRRGKKPAIVAIGRSILVIVPVLLSDEQAQFVDLGPDCYAACTTPERKVRQHVRELQAPGYTVTLDPAA
jgi:transposase